MKGPSLSKIASNYSTTYNELEKTYNSQKKELEHFHYIYPLGLDSIQLVEKQLSELLNTTQGFQDFKAEIETLKSQLESEKALSLPLIHENAKLLKENKELHRELIKLKESFDFKDLILSHVMEKLEEVETESLNLRKKFNELLNKM